MTPRDQERLLGVHPQLVTAVGEIFQELANQGHLLFVIEGVRTTSRQVALWATGRNPSDIARGIKVVTFKDGVTHRSNHQPHDGGYGYAVDCAFLPSEAFGNPFDLRFPWEEYGKAGEARGLIWGGRWRMGDLPHLELPEAGVGGLNRVLKA